ncbi:MAG TPA: RICIN domain-containing protein [Mycobacteriales bacterium]|nr:RICIN domain-containing protein [Mycobacteriales bacterium]
MILDRLPGKVARFIARRSDRSGDAGFAMIFALFLVLALATASIAVAGVFASQLQPTRLARKAVQSGDAAGAGLQSALGVLRNTITNGVGDLTKLPCSSPADSGGVTLQIGSPPTTLSVPGNRVSGTAVTTTNPGATETYTVSIVYYTEDPTQYEKGDSASITWLRNNAIGCEAGIVDEVPTYALLESYGYDTQVTGANSTSGNRQLYAVYQFNAVANPNVSGGRIAQFNSANPDSMCLDTSKTATSSAPDPVANQKLYMQPCLAAGTPQQTWRYRSDLTIQYGGNTALNLCITNQGSSGPMSPPTSAGTPELETCVTNGSAQTYDSTNRKYPGGNAQEDQEWAYDDNGHFQAPSSTGTVGAGICLTGNGGTANAATAGTQFTLSSAACSAGSSTDPSSWYPDAQVGAGQAGGNTTGAPGSPTNQFVNYELYGRCLDVSGQNFANNLIAYPCKQAPNASTLAWNELWNFQVQQTVSGVSWGIFYTNCPPNTGGCVGGSTSTGEKDCLVGPTTENSQVTGVKCPTGTVPANQLWQVTGDLAGDYPDSYLLVNKQSGMCMAADPSQLNSSSHVTEIVVTNCNGEDVPSASNAVKNDLLLKWNAPPNNPTPGLSDVQRVSTSGGNAAG